MALWTPANLTSCTLEGWYFLRDVTGSKADGATVTQSSGLVSQWADSSGKGRTLYNGTSDKPTYSATGLGNNYPAVTTTDSNQGFLTNAGVAYPSGSLLGAFAVVNLTSTGSRLVTFTDSDSDPDYGANGFIPLYFDSNLQTFYNFSSQSVPFSTGAIDLIESYGTSITAAACCVNAGTLSGNVSTNFAGIQMQRMGVFSHAHSGAVGEGAVGSLAEVVIIAGPPSNSDVQKLEGYLAWNNGTQGSLPANHPYKSAAPTAGTSSATITGATTEAGDASSGTAVLSTAAAGATTESRDTTQGAATAGTATASVTGAATETGDISSGAASTSATVSGATTEAPDATAGSATLSVSATGATTESADATAGTAAASTAATGSATERSDASSGTAASSTTASGAATETPDATAGSVTAGAPTASVTGATTETPDASSGSAATSTSMSGAATESPDATAASVTAGVTLAGATAETADATSGNVTRAAVVVGATTEQPDTTSGSAAAVAVAVVSGAAVEMADMTAGAITLPLIIVGAAQEAADTSVGVVNTNRVASVTLRIAPVPRVTFRVNRAA